MMAYEEKESQLRGMLLVNKTLREMQNDKFSPKRKNNMTFLPNYRVKNPRFPLQTTGSR